jgi:hypothetical protein
MNINRLILFFLIILFIFIIGEGAYLYFISFNSRSKFSQMITTSPVLSSQLVSSSETDIINSDTVDFINKFKNNPNHKFYLTVEQSGFIGEFNFINDDYPSYNLKIVDEKGNKVIDYSLSKENKTKREFFKIADDKKIPITINDLKVGNKILVIYKENMFDNNDNSMEFRIIE